MKLVSDLMTESNQAVRAVHICNSWLSKYIRTLSSAFQCILLSVSISFSFSPPTFALFESN